MRTVLLSAVAGLALSTAGAGWAQDLNDPAEVLTARHGYMLMMAMQLSTLGGMAKGDVAYDPAAAKVAADSLAALASVDSSKLWVAGTENGVLEDSFALPEIITNVDDRNAKLNDLRTASAALASAAGTDVEAMKAAMGGVGAACSACHKQYRKPEE
jgi:cytochrome c556